MARSPLFDIYDPYGELEEQARLGLLPGEDEEYFLQGPIEGRRLNVSDLMPAEQKSSMLGTLANAGASGLTGLGWLLDIPGSFARGTVSGLMEGDPLKGFKTALAPSDQRVSGRDLLRQMGVAGRDDNWGNWAGGFATEILTDPLFFLNPGALLGRGAYSAAGKAASRAGLLDDVALLAKNRNIGSREFLRTNTLRDLAAMPEMGADALTRIRNATGGTVDEVLDQKLAGAMTFKIPGTGIETLIDGGPLADMAARGLDRFGEGLKYNPLTGPLVNRVTKNFDTTVLERIDPDDQWRARQAVATNRQLARDAREEAAQNWRFAQKADVSSLPEAFRNFDDPRIQNAIRDSIEAQVDPERLAQLVDQDAIRAIDAIPEWRQYRDWLRDTLEQTQTRRAELGLETPTAQSLYGTGFIPSQRVQFAQERVPTVPGKAGRKASRYDKGERVYSVDDVVGRGRNPYLDLERRSETLRRLMTGNFGTQLRDRLYGATDEQIPGMIDEAFESLGLEVPYSRLEAEGQTAESLRQFLSDPNLSAAERAPYEKSLQGLEAQSSSMKRQLGDLLRTADRQFADKGIGLFDRHTATDVLRYTAGQARSEAGADVILKTFVDAASDIPAHQMPGGGAENLLDVAARDLGFNKGNLRKRLQAMMPGRNVDELSIPQKAIEDLKAIAPRTASDPASPLTRGWNSYTNAFKVGALANPAYHTRNLYSGYLSSLASGEMGPIDLIKSMYAGWQAGRGNYDAIAKRLEDAPAFRTMSDPAERAEEFLIGDARNKLGQGQIGEVDGLAEVAADNIFPGADKMDPIRFFGEGGLLYDPNRSWRDWSTVRGVDFMGIAGDRRAPAETLNPLLQLHERTSRRVEDALRLGTYTEALRKGYSPDAAADLVTRTQVDYSPQAFTNFERKIKQYVPFYSYTRGIAPSIIDNLLYRPGGLQGQGTRAISSLSRPNEEFFVPEDLRHTASIPLPGLVGKDKNIQRFLTNIDVPWEGAVNLLSPGTGDTLYDRVTSGIQKTGLNLLGQTNPLIKAPLELLLDRQLYSGRQMSDLYSMLEKDLGPVGRVVEQVGANLPGGTKIASLIRTARDERLSPAEKLLKIGVNNTLGLKFTDRDPERTKSIAARNMLNDMLKAVPGVRTYENITVPDEVLQSMQPEQKDMYLLYKIIQAEAAKRARERKKMQMDPLELLDVVR